VESIEHRTTLGEAVALVLSPFKTLMSQQETSHLSHLQNEDDETGKRVRNPPIGLTMKESEPSGVLESRKVMINNEEKVLKCCSSLTLTIRRSRRGSTFTPTMPRKNVTQRKSDGKT